MQDYASQAGGFSKDVGGKSKAIGQKSQVAKTSNHYMTGIGGNTREIESKMFDQTTATNTLIILHMAYVMLAGVFVTAMRKAFVRKK